LKNFPNSHFYIALLHYPVYNRRREVVTTAVANMDIHDISRAAKTFGVRFFYIVTPIAEQQQLVEKILDHWLSGYGAGFNPSRKEAFGIVRLESSLDEVVEDIAELSGCRPILVATGANLSDKHKLRTSDALRDEIMSSQSPFLVLFGTGSGLADDVIEKADYHLTPIQGPSDYNHLSVRSAVSIILDQLWGKKA
jgi:hypothetical protein